ncbi:hypothetical protein EVJ58_g5524 [Rhodofomes roseus]|uniref:Chromatin remodeling factor mit1 n=1 Tax=Rhodofomes roseus TaxID=34475 RepID=A0A4Y9YEH4_9APHY|nr:hypothetical protein EVJ58_g5524 [Rhodofomes roseus]
MPEPPPDPALLFTPPPARAHPDSPARLSSVANGPPTSDILVRSRSSSLSSPDESVSLGLPSARKRTREQPFYIDVPPLPEEEKALYLPFAEQLMSIESAFDDFSEIVGVHEIDGVLHYFARDSDGILHRFPVDEFKHARPDLVKKYEQAKKAGTLGPFDPSASYVHINSRVRLQVHIKRPAPTRKRPPPARGYKGGASAGGKGKRRELPFSPKKTRSRGRAVVARGSDAESDSDVQEVVAPRRSSRSKRSARSNLRDADIIVDSEDEEYDDSDEEEYAERKPGKKSAKKKQVKRGSRAAYGHFRPIADMEADERVDEEGDMLRIHRQTCEKCHTLPTHQAMVQARKKKPGRRKKKGSDDESSEDELARLEALGGWVRCLKCPVVAHWACLAKTQRDEILKAAFERDKIEWQAAKDRALAEGDEFTEPAMTKRSQLEQWQSTDFICTSCMKGGVCMACREVVVKPDVIEAKTEEQQPDAVAAAARSGDVEMADATAEATSEKAAEDDKDNEQDEDGKELAFRCITCKRLAHYAHLPIPADWEYDPDDVTPAMLADHYQTTTNWQCGDCSSFVYNVEHILAWRPYPEDAVEPARPAGEPVNYKAMLPREYLVKWADRSYRRTSWVPHGGGSKIPLLPEPVEEEKVDEPAASQGPSFEIGEESTDGQAPEEKKVVSVLSAMPDAERRIPPVWKRVDRVLDVLLWHPEARLGTTKQKAGRKGKGKGKKRGDSDEEEMDEDEPRMVAVRRELDAAYELGEQPSQDLIETVEEYEERTNKTLRPDDIHRVVWAFFKWDDLGYEDASWDSPPRPGSASYTAFDTAFERYLRARSVTVPLKNRKEEDLFDNTRPKNAWRKKYAFTPEQQPENGQESQFKLMPFQVDGVNWLCDNWWNHQNCILADEMGLGKTVQIASFIGHVATQHEAFPVLVVVPNSTISNWVREFERWAPRLRVVPFYGESKAREIIKKYELFHPKDNVLPKTTGAKYHVLVTTYEMITNPKDFTPVFKNTPRWEVLVVDEGQRLKSDASLIFKKLKDLNTMHRVIMTGTPLNNNIRELFNLMNFLDPGEWTDLAGLARQYEELTEDKVKELHAKLKPYFLRRIKSENEVIVPISMAPLQKEVYRSILSQNLGLLRVLATGSTGARVSAAVSKANMNNILMQLRKCLQHPYLVSEEIEPKGLSQEETHAKLIDASAKLGLLKTMLPKLRERGHRVLLFSQFSIALDVIEDFLIGEGVKYLRLDGNTKQADRQKGMDEFNKPDSDVFIYLLTTRAGGVGINLWTADTVIIFDPDFNPHQDLQAIARAHRFGQKKTCLVFKLMVKGSAEDKIVQTGKKKLVLDHLIVQKMDDEDGSKEDVQSILMFGAQALFQEEQNAEDHSEHDIDKLIERTEQEGDEVESESNANAAFSFAKIWSADKDELEEVQEDTNEDQADSWAQTLERIAAERVKVQAAETTGRGVRRKAAAVFPQQDLGQDDLDTPHKDAKKTGKGRGKGKKSKSHISDDSDVYAAPGTASDSDSNSSHPASLREDDLLSDIAKHQHGVLADPDIPLASTSTILLPPAQPKATRDSQKLTSGALERAESPQPLSPIENTSEPRCGLCGESHGDQPCDMTESPENLAQYRLMLLVHAGDEPVEDRRAAIQVIDETLHKRGMIHLIYGQPLHLLERPAKEGKPLHRKPKPEAPLPLQSLKRAVLPSSSKVSGNSGGSQSTKPQMNGAKPLLSTKVEAGSSSLGRTERGKGIIPSPHARPSGITSAIAGPSKRPPSPPMPTDSPKLKKVKSLGGAGCPICGAMIHHLVKDCPEVKAGPKRVKRAIRRLENDPAHTATVNVLRHILTKQQRKALANAAAPAPPAIELSD